MRRRRDVQPRWCCAYGGRQPRGVGGGIECGDTFATVWSFLPAWGQACSRVVWGHQGTGVSWALPRALSLHWHWAGPWSIVNMFG